MADIMTSLDTTFSDIFTKRAPALPANAKQTLVRFLPWLSLIFGLLMIPVVLAVFGVGLVATPFMVLGGGGVGSYWVAALFAAAYMVMELMAVQPLMAKKVRGWRLLYYVALLSIVQSILSLSVIGLIGNAIELWLLYQIRPSYK